MVFQSLEFLLFLAAVTAVCVPVGRRSVRAGQWLLLGGCALFICADSGRGMDVLLFSAWLTWWTARFLVPGARHRRAILWVTVCYLVGVLAVFKYTGFFTGGVVSMGWAPLGLSFFTFQQLWYLKEVYAGHTQPQTLGDYGLYAFFFPTVSSGPILKPDAFFPQLSGGSFLRPNGQDAAAGLYALALGLGKKVLLADSLAVVVNNGWADPAALSAPAAWLVMLGYTLQLYFDFSGYCDMAAGAARLLGIRLPVNFDSPYRALSVGEFWKRWHITLTSFLRECVYFPLGGSKRGPLRAYGNILLVFLISGFWHGAGWTFLVWGGLHGMAQVTERLWGDGRGRLPKAVRWVLTFAFLNVAWVFFRAPDLTAAMAMLRTAVLGGGGLGLTALTAGLLPSEITAVTTVAPALRGWMPLLVSGALYAAGLLAALLPGNTIRRMETFRPTALRGALLAVVTVWAVLSLGENPTFIYSNF